METVQYCVTLVTAFCLCHNFGVLGQLFSRISEDNCLCLAVEVVFQCTTSGDGTTRFIVTGCSEEQLQFLSTEFTSETIFRNCYNSTLGLNVTAQTFSTNGTSYTSRVTLLTVLNTAITLECFYEFQGERTRIEEPFTIKPTVPQAVTNISSSITDSNVNIRYSWNASPAPPGCEVDYYINSENCGRCSLNRTVDTFVDCINDQPGTQRDCNFSVTTSICGMNKIATHPFFIPSTSDPSTTVAPSNGTTATPASGLSVGEIFAIVFVPLCVIGVAAIVIVIVLYLNGKLCCKSRRTTLPLMNMGLLGSEKGIDVDSSDGKHVAPPASASEGKVDPAASASGGKVDPAASASGGKLDPPASGGKVDPPASGGKVDPPASASGGKVDPPASASGGKVDPPASGGKVDPPASASGGKVDPPASGGKVDPAASGGKVDPPASASGGKVDPAASASGGKAASASEGKVDPAASASEGKVDPPANAAGHKVDTIVNVDGDPVAKADGGNGVSEAVTERPLQQSEDQVVSSDGLGQAMSLARLVTQHGLALQKALGEASAQNPTEVVLREENQELRAQKEQLVNDGQELRDQVGRLLSENEELLEKAQAGDTKLKEEIERLNKELKEKATLLVMKDQETVRKLQENDAEVQKILAEKEKEEARLKQIMDQLEERSGNLSKQDTQLREEIERLNKELKEKETLLVMKDQEMERKLQEKDAEVKKILAEKEKEEARLKQIIDQLEERSGNLSKQVQGLEESLEREKTQRQRDVNSLREQLDSVTAKVNVLMGDKQNVDSQSAMDSEETVDQQRSQNFAQNENLPKQKPASHSKEILGIGKVQAIGESNSRMNNLKEGSDKNGQGLTALPHDH